MQTIRLNVDALEIASFTTTKETTGVRALAPTDFCTAGMCGSGISETDGVFQCKSCGPCCQ
jgi:hypothetical protein